MQECGDARNIGKTCGATIFDTGSNKKKLKNVKHFLVMEIRLPKYLLYLSDHFTIANSIVNILYFHQRIREINLYGFGPKFECSSESFRHL